MSEKRIYQLALFGDPVSHSLSPQIHQHFAQQFDLRINYQLLQVKADDLHRAVTGFFANNGFAANVTLPHKLAIKNSLKSTTKRAEQAQAVNTLYLDKDSQVCGDNTDGIGFIQDLSKRCHFDFHNKNILILGAGGAVQGIVPEIMGLKPKQLVIANRSVDKAAKMTRYHTSQAVSFEQLAELETTFDLIIHASSLGHQGKTLKFSKNHAHPQTVCYDLSYGKAARPFIEYSHSMGVTDVYDGIGMLIEQAAAAFKIWFDSMPDTKGLIEILKS